MKNKTFDSIAMKRRGAEKIYDPTKDLTLEEELAYWQQRGSASTATGST